MGSTEIPTPPLSSQGNKQRQNAAERHASSASPPFRFLTSRGLSCSVPHALCAVSEFHSGQACRDTITTPLDTVRMTFVIFCARAPRFASRPPRPTGGSILNRNHSPTPASMIVRREELGSPRAPICTALRSTSRSRSKTFTISAATSYESSSTRRVLPKRRGHDGCSRYRTARSNSERRRQQSLRDPRKAAARGESPWGCLSSLLVLRRTATRATPTT